MNTNTALRKYASPARIRSSNKVLYTMFRTAHRLCSDVFFLFLGCQTFTIFKLASLWMRGAQERALLVPDDNIVIYGSCTIPGNEDENNSSSSSTQQVQAGVHPPTYTCIWYVVI